MQTYIVTLRHDRGRVRIATTAKCPDSAIEQVINAELAPFSAVLSVYAENPCPPVSCRYGAPMGRPSSPGFGSNPNRREYRARRVRLNGGGYDPGGAYWGHRPSGLSLFAVQDGWGLVDFVDAYSAQQAINIAGGFEPGDSE